MNILYGVVGEGMGHAMRSSVILEHLTAQGHNVTVMTSGRAVDFLSKRFPGVKRIHGLHMVYEENQVRPIKTLLSNARDGLTGLPKNIAAYFDIFANENIDAVISDFESWTYLYAKLHGLPVLSIDNMQVINRCKLPKEILKGHRLNFEIARNFVRGKLPGCDQYFITSFFRPKLRLKHTRLYPPILRLEILAANKRPGTHLLVYTTGEGNSGFAETLKSHGLECRIYGMRRDLTEDFIDGCLIYRPFSEAGFIDDLASCRGVIAGGGFTLMGEAVYLGKPMLAVPMDGQFEQTLNARYLEHLGYGRMAETIEDEDTVHDFLMNLSRYEAKLAGYKQDGNVRILRSLDAWLKAV